jgi:two-component system sensor histidine kinase/response regulator
MEQQGPAVEEIKAARTRGDIALAERLAHTLKGVAGNIGAKDVQTASNALENLLREGAQAAQVDDALARVADALTPLIAQLQVAFRPTKPESYAQTVAPTPADPARFQQAAAELACLLGNFDPGVVDFIEAHRDTLRPVFPGEAWMQFEKLTGSYAFTEAQALLAMVLSSQPPA